MYRVRLCRLYPSVITNCIAPNTTGINVPVQIETVICRARRLPSLNPLHLWCFSSLANSSMASLETRKSIIHYKTESFNQQPSPGFPFQKVVLIVDTRHLSCLFQVQLVWNLAFLNKENFNVAYMNCFNPVLFNKERHSFLFEFLVSASSFRCLGLYILLLACLSFVFCNFYVENPSRSHNS